MKNISENNSHTPRFTFKKEERLCSKKVIDLLFAEGKSFVIFPLKIIYLETDSPLKAPVQAAFSVGKRIFKRAVQRNMIKRKMREAYRLNKLSIYCNPNDFHLAVFFIFIGNKIPDFKLVETAMKSGLNRINKELKSETKNND